MSGAPIRARRHSIDFDGRTYTFDATPIYEGWDVVVHSTAEGPPLMAFEFWRDGMRGPLADPTLGGLAREIMELLLPPAKVRHATPERLEHEVRIYLRNRHRAPIASELALLPKLVRQAQHGDGFPNPRAALKAANAIAVSIGFSGAAALSVVTLEGAVLRAIVARAKLGANKAIPTEELRVLARLAPGPFELPRGRDARGLVPAAIALHALREKGVVL